MAKEKKRGFFSWLGFGQKEQSEQPKAQEHEDVTQAESAPEALIEDGAQRQDEAVIIASEQAADSTVLLDDADQDTGNKSPAEVIIPSTADPESAITANVNLAAEEEAYAQQQDRIVTEEVASIETLIVAAEAETPPKEALTETEEAAWQAERTEMEARIAGEEVAGIESLLSETAAKEQEPDPVADIKAPETGADETPAVASFVAESPVDKPADDRQVLADETPVVAPFVAESPMDKPADDGQVLADETPAVAPFVAESPMDKPADDGQILADEAPVVAPLVTASQQAQPEDIAAPVAEEMPEAAVLTEDAAADENQADEHSEPEMPATASRGDVEQEKPTKEGFFARLKRSLVKTKQNLGSGFMGLFRGKKIDDDLFEELEEQLLIADVGVETTRKIIAKLTETASRKQLKDAEALYTLLKEEMSDILAKVHEPLQVEGKTPFVILMVGVNGVGKTTTIGKLARQFELEGKSVMLAAGDTFRAAAVEQLQVWGERNNIPVVAQHTGADSASVIFDAIQAAKARHIDVLIADTAGRLQNKAHLMEELKKIVRVMKKLDDAAPHEIMLTLDASTGQNAISQAKLFHEAVGLTGITLTKLDGTAKGGVIFSIADQFGIPIRYIGVGEQLADLRPFNSEDFIEALFARED